MGKAPHVPHTRNTHFAMMKFLVLLALAPVALAAPLALSTATTTAPNLTYWHNYVDENGLAHFTKCNFSNFSTSSIGPGVVPSWHEYLNLGDLTPEVAVFPEG